MGSSRSGSGLSRSVSDGQPFRRMHEWSPVQTSGSTPNRGCTTVRPSDRRSEEHTSELQSPYDLVCRLLLEKKKQKVADRFPKCQESCVQLPRDVDDGDTLVPAEQETRLHDRGTFSMNQLVIPVSIAHLQS